MRLNRFIKKLFCKNILQEQQKNESEIDIDLNYKELLLRLDKKITEQGLVDKDKLTIALWGNNEINLEVINVLTESNFFDNKWEIHAFISSAQYIKEDKVCGYPSRSEIWLKENPSDLIINTSYQYEVVINKIIKNIELIDRTVCFYGDFDVNNESNKYFDFDDIDFEKLEKPVLNIEDYKSDKPKNVLFFSENAMSLIQGGGIVVYNVLKGLPPENLLGFYSYTNITPVPEYADRYFHLNSSSLVLDRNDHKKQNYVYKNYNELINKDFRTVLSKVKIKNFKPEIVYFSGTSVGYLKLAVMASKHFNIPMVQLNMDNWIDDRPRKFYDKEMQAFFMQESIEVLKEASSLSLISTTNSPGMSKHLIKLTGYNHIPANNCTFDLFENDFDESTIITNNEVPIVTYAGAINRTLQGETLIELASVFAELNAEGCKAQLHIYTPWQFSGIANSMSIPNVVIYKGQAGQSELKDIYLNSDFLLGTVTFRDRDITHFKYSLSTKLSEYLCVGKPVIAIGSKEWHLIHYVQQNNCGYPIFLNNTFKRTQVKEEFRKILSTPKQKLYEIGKNNRKLWEKAHDSAILSRETRLAIGLKPLTKEIKTISLTS
ncbi:MAG: hypothetical protein PHC34_07575 [Candidatus Gastranaerophilales bacterium]|nr:hypothetical protein [Candidatus Gastranaerophilales bacterium]